MNFRLWANRGFLGKRNCIFTNNGGAGQGKLTVLKFDYFE
jgi:hypothetical protein